MPDLFDDVFEGRGPKQTAFNIAEAFMAVALAVATADGEFSKEEREELSLNLRRMNIFHTYSLQELRDALEKVSQILLEQGVDALIAGAKAALHPDYRETAYFLATDLAVIDTVLHDEERKLLNRLQCDLEINKEMALKIIEVVLVKNRK